MRLIAVYVFLWASVTLRADDGVLTAVKAADDARVAAMIACDTAKLDEVLSDALHYGHSKKLIESKAEHIASLVSRSLIYRKIDYKRREFSVVAPGVALCNGRALVEVGTEKMMFLVDIHFLAVWRLENQRWRLFAWQSSRNGEITPLEPISTVLTNQPPQHNAGSRPSSDDLPASETPSSFGPSG